MSSTWACDQCNNIHKTEEDANECCVCTTCNKKFKKISSYGSTCETCDYGRRVVKAYVFVTFRSAEHGGRQKPFRGSLYTAVARVQGPSRVDRWGIVIDFVNPIVAGDDPVSGIMTVCHEGETIFRKGADLDLDEGGGVTAVVHVDEVVADERRFAGDLDAPDGAEVDGYIRVGDHWWKK